MKILHTVESYHPAVGGMQEVVKQLSERLVKLGHEVTVAARDNSNRKAEEIINGVIVKSFKVDGNIVRGMTGDIEGYKQFLLNADFDIVTNFAAQQWATDIALPILDKIKGVKVNVPTGFSGFYAPEYKEYFENMKSWMKGYDMNIFLSNDYRDINFAREIGITKNVIIPNGAGEDEFSAIPVIDVRKKWKIPADHFLILHVGSFTNIKGQVEALDIFLKSDIKDATLMMIGNNNDHLTARLMKDYYYRLRRKWNEIMNNKRIIITYVDRPETVAAYKAADLFLFPSNVECSPIVLFEAMASRTPFLTTDVGNSKEIIEWSNGGLLLPTEKDQLGYSHAKINESVKILNNIYKDDVKRKELEESGYKSWKEKFSWEKITLQYEQLYKSLLDVKKQVKSVK